MMTIPLIPFYTPFKAAEVLYHGLIKRDSHWIDMKKRLDQDLITVEPFVESAPQALIMSTIWALTEGCIGPSFEREDIGTGSRPFSL